jgi:hypothetical protein
VTTDYGFQKMLTIADTELLGFGSRAELAAAFGSELDRQARMALVGRWARVQEAAGKAAEASREEMFEADFDDMSFYHFRRLPSVPDDLGDMTQGSGGAQYKGQFITWQRDLRRETNLLSRQFPNKTKEELVDLAADRLLNASRMQVETGAGTRPLGGLTVAEAQGAKMALPPHLASEFKQTHMDLNRVTTDRLSEATLRILEDRGDDYQPSEREVYETAADIILREDQKKRREEDIAIQVESDRGMNMALGRFRDLINEPQAMGILKTGTTIRHGVDIVGRPLRTRFSIDREAMFTDRYRWVIDMAMARFGKEIAASYGIDSGDMVLEMEKIVRPELQSQPSTTGNLSTVAPRRNR